MLPQAIDCCSRAGNGTDTSIILVSKALQECICVVAVYELLSRCAGWYRDDVGMSEISGGLLLIAR